ncbi:MBL fold metallo-hydrolase [Philodulcilactobacillus myokoensis]|uniref:MBL fold metallo-hydrolase n=1 Tax=Philodulcilactobacillus myokoensis TaxID=2929573 RepID=A0A9W6B1B5_9LACO|nr:MBL fold metallo-hydrolase [Philodulcilactobacillus myokoensis]GLB47037.1 MBL fold metallo-hydrolase [Philodulcilactobacillus myokoensis]
MKLTVLGYYGGFPFNGIGTSGYLIQSHDYNLLMDCGSGILLNLEKQLDPLKLNAVILSHYHHDHTADVGVLQYYWQLHPKNRREPVLPIYGNTEDPLNFGGLTWMHSTKGYGYNEFSVLHLGPFKITFKKTHHPVPAFAMRIEELSTHKILVFTSDTNYFDGLIDFAKNADLLLTDTNFYSNKTGQKWHMTSTESGFLAKRSNCKHLLISHLPQFGNLKQLLSETKESAGSHVNVEIATLNKKVNI